MTLLSSRATFYYKRIFPFVWLGLLALFVAGFAVSGLTTDAFPVGMLLAPVVMAVAGFFIFRKLVFDLVDEVWDDGQALVVRNKGLEERIALSDIVNVSASVMVNPPRVTLTVRRPTAFGTAITFCGPLRAFPFSRNPVIDALIRRIDASRTRQPAAAGGGGVT